MLVHDLGHGKVHVLNATAGHVLRLCDGTDSTDDIAGLIHADTGADLTLVRRDVAAVIASFVALQLLAT